MMHKLRLEPAEFSYEGSSFIVLATMTGRDRRRGVGKELI